MKTYYFCVAAVFLLAYAVFHFGFRAGGDGQLYKIDDRIAFELRAPDANFNGVAIRSYRRTNVVARLICGACEYDKTGAVEMVNVNFRSGDFVYTDFPQHEVALTDIVDTRTGEAIRVSVPADFKFGDDFSRLAEYKQRKLGAGDRFKLDQDYVRANFALLSTFTNRCFYAHIIFAAAFFLLAFPNVLIFLLDAFFRSHDPADPANWHRTGGN